MRAETKLVLATRRRLCHEVEAQAKHPEASGALDFDAYIRCRTNTEALLKRTRPVLYTNRKGFIFYTAQGARLAREADAIVAACPTATDANGRTTSGQDLFNPAR